WLSAFVGTGSMPQSAHPDEAVRSQLNTSWEVWTDGDISDGYGLQELAARQMIIDGNVFAMMTIDAGANLQIRLLDAEQFEPAHNRGLGADARDGSGVEAFRAFKERPGLPFSFGGGRVRRSCNSARSAQGRFGLITGQCMAGDAAHPI